MLLKTFRGNPFFFTFLEKKDHFDDRQVVSNLTNGNLAVFDDMMKEEIRGHVLKWRLCQPKAHLLKVFQDIRHP